MKRENNIFSIVTETEKRSFGIVFDFKDLTVLGKLNHHSIALKSVYTKFIIIFQV